MFGLIQMQIFTNFLICAVKKIRTWWKSKEIGGSTKSDIDGQAKKKAGLMWIVLSDKNQIDYWATI